ncbi:unnamed protein product [Oikopleura dioica]|uniref:Uncharacterized protein n=1 Tax=Oikopleura dioica TaxID=34765 RepID=E4YKJ7_OIKDI|nr:unnamed protein product [Oikopleura dioica]
MQIILNKFEKEVDPLIQSLRKEYEYVVETLPPLSGVCDILNRLESIQNNKTTSLNRLAVEFYYGEFEHNWFDYDFSTDFVVTTMRLYDEEIIDDNGETKKSLNGEELPELDTYRNDVYLHNLFVYYLDREDPRTVQPKLVRTIELEDEAYNYLDDPYNQIKLFVNQDFCVCGNILGVSKRLSGKFEFDFYDMDKSRNVALYSFPDYDEETDIRVKPFRFFFKSNFFIFSRDDGEGICIEIHEISSQICKLARKFELQTDFGHFDDLYIESIGKLTWNLYISPGRTPETPTDQISVNEIVFIDMRKNIVTKRSKTQNSKIGDKLNEIMAKVEKEMAKDAVCGHVRMHENHTHEDKRFEDDYEIHLKFYA